MTDMNTPYDSDTWWAIFDGLNGSPWEADDIADCNVWLPGGSPDARPAAEAMQHVYEAAQKWAGPIDPEGAVAAVLNAAYEFHACNGWRPVDVKEMAGHFAVFYHEIEDPLQDRLDEVYGRMPLRWLGDYGRSELEKEIRRDSEIWVEDGPPGVWVFTKPCHP